MKRNVVRAVFAAILLAAFIVLVYFVNVNGKSPIISKFEKGAIVPVEDNYFWKSGENMDGYTVQVTGSQFLSLDEFVGMYQVDTDEFDLVCENLLLVTVSFEKTVDQGGEEDGIDLRRYTLMGTDYCLTISSSAFMAVNPDMPGMMFSLIPGKPMEIVLPFAVYSSYVSLDHIKGDMPLMEICAYPEMKLVGIC